MWGAAISAVAAAKLSLVRGRRGRRTPVTRRGMTGKAWHPRDQVFNAAPAASPHARGHAHARGRRHGRARRHGQPPPAVHQRLSRQAGCRRSASLCVRHCRVGLCEHCGGVRCARWRRCNRAQKAHKRRDGGRWEARGRAASCPPTRRPHPSPQQPQHVGSGRRHERRAAAAAPAAAAANAFAMPWSLPRRLRRRRRRAGALPGGKLCPQPAVRRFEPLVLYCDRRHWQRRQRRQVLRRQRVQQLWPSGRKRKQRFAFGGLPCGRVLRAAAGEAWGIEELASRRDGSKLSCWAMAGRWRAQLLGDGRAGASSGGRWPGGDELSCWAMAGRWRAQLLGMTERGRA
eukprot:352827-Chlamydomonas_euryale.AAC.5